MRKPYLAALLLAAAYPAHAQIWTGPYGPGGTWNVYRVVTTAATWSAADTAAKAAEAQSSGLPVLAGNTTPGHLVQISSEDENTFVALAAALTPGSGNSNVWIGLNDNNAEQGSNQVGWEWSGTTGGSGTNGAQIAGVDTDYLVWAPGEPNNSGTENAGEMRNDGRWNDNKHNLSTTTRRYVIEWSLGLSSPPEGARQFPVTYTAPYGPGGTWNLYKIIGASENFDNARSIATSRTAGSTGVSGVATGPLSNLTGTLATVASQQENDFLFRISGYAGSNTISTWLGATDDPNREPTATESGTSKTSGWVWMDRNGSQPWTYQKFGTRFPLNSGEQPDNAGTTESAIELLGTSFWNDITPAATTLRRYIIEWHTEATSPIAGASLPQPILPGPTPSLTNTHSVGTWAIKEQRAGLLTANINGALSLVYANTSTSAVQGTRPVLNQTDNAVSGTTGRSTIGLFWPKTDLLGDAASADDNNYTVFAKTRMALSGTGPYTLNVHSDDGFICRISGPGTVTISQVSGAGMQDPADSAFYYPFGIGDTNTRAIFTVSSPGEYEVEYIGWEGTGGSVQEVSWCEGAAPNDWDGNWQLLGGPVGGTPVLPAADSFNAPAPTGNEWQVRYPAPGTVGTLTTVAGAATALQNATGTTDTVAPVINFADPNNGGNRGLFTADIPHPGDTTADDNNFVWGARTLLNIPAAGLYTIGAHCDDTIAIRLRNGAKWRGRVWGTTAQGHIDTNDDSVMYWFIGSGDSNIRAAAWFPAPGNYEVQALYYEGTGGAAAELYYAPGIHFADNDTGSWKLMGDTTELTPLVPTSIPGAPAAGNGAWNVRYLRFSGLTLNTLQDSIAALSSGLGESIYGSTRVLNFSDPSNPGTTGLFGGDQPLPGDLEFTNDDDVAMHARGSLFVPSSGIYTFGVRCSDGFALRIGKNPWLSRNGVGGIDPADPTVLAWTAGSTALTENLTRSLIFLPAGVHPIEFISFDRSREFMAEVFAIPGNQLGTGEYAAGATANNGGVNINAADAWRLVGYKAGPNPLGIITVKDPGFSVVQTIPYTTTVPAGWGITAAQTDNWLATQPLTTLVNRDMINLRDTAGGTGLFPNDYPNPNDVANVDDNYYVSRFEGTLIVPVTGTYNVGWQGDDGGYFEFLTPPAGIQPQFTRIIANALATATITTASNGAENARIELNAGGGNTRTTGEVTLEAGEYPVRIQWFEGNGGSYFEAFATPSVADARIVRLINKAAATTLPDTDGLALVDTTMNVLNYSLTGNQFSLTFTSIPGASYSIESATSPAGPWTVTDPAVTAASTATTWTGTVSPGTEPGRLFFRARLN